MSSFVTAIDSIQKTDNSVVYRRVNVRLTGVRRGFFRRKYVFDKCCGSFLLFVFSPLILVLWLMVKLTSRGPGFYRQTRVGLNGIKFDVIKLRSMRIDAEQSGRAVWCSKGDDRMTWLGKILRALHLDELPQLFNVARGEMSLVGPRPERPQICEELKTKIDGYYDRVLVKPGITGLSQINLPPDTCLADVRRKQVLDLHYINEANWWLEFRILVATTLRMFGIKGVTTMNLMGLCRLSYLNKMKTKPWLPKKPNWDRERQTVPARRPHHRFPGIADSDGEIDLDSDYDSSLGSSSGIGSGIGLV
jgi:lipopolysaccharide/colanic/teichoic acid biosynthesis glycosyltransferase